MNVVLYSTHCPKCAVLENELKAKNIEYIECNDVDAMLSKGIDDVPRLEADGEMMDYISAMYWIEKQGGNL